MIFSGLSVHDDPMPVCEISTIDSMSHISRFTTVVDKSIRPSKLCCSIERVSRRYIGKSLCEQIFFLNV